LKAIKNKQSTINLNTSN